jgi:thiol-disulfide isomerase/thioredoxin
MPNFRLATMQDSTMILSKDIPKEGIVMLKYFSPDCDHCQKEAQKFVAKKDSLKNIQTLWMSGDWASLQDIKTFAKTYGIEQLNPKYIGKDVGSNLVLYYDLKSVPFTAIYKDNQLIKQYKNDINFDELIAMNTGKFIPAPKDSILKTVRKSPFLKKN